MIVYGSRDRAASPAALIRRALATLGRDDPATVLIDVGELEAGVADALCPDADRHDLEPLLLLRRASLAAARVFLGRGDAGPVKAALVQLAALPLPGTVRISAPEGYAYYALYPEAYVEAARRFVRSERPAQAVVIGIRSIGTSLSAAVAAALEAAGVSVESFTVRPRGHPFDRRVELAPAFRACLRGLAGARFLAVDEGPGLSGSSFVSVASALTELGVPEDRIVFFPSWIPDGARFVSDTARAAWPRYRKYSVAFEELDGLRPPAGAIDYSAGAWRRFSYAEENEWPAVQPQHERRKYRVGPELWRFAGLGRYGRAKQERGQILADEGFSPPVLELANGFLRTQFVEGRAMSARPAPGREFLGLIARYLAFVRRSFPSDRMPPFDEIAAMVRHNSPDAPELEIYRPAVSAGATTAIDGRMLPHEWLATANGWVKTDSLDHHDDHFFPGCQDIAWDLAGAGLEFGLDERDCDYLIESYAKMSGDRDIRARLPFYLIAYRAYRIGYCTMAAETLGGSPDAMRFRTAVERLRRLGRCAPPQRDSPAPRDGR